MPEKPCPSPYMLYKSWRKALRLICLSGIFVVVPLLLGLRKPLPGYIWFCISFFAFCMAVGIYNLLDKRPQIVLDETGLWDRTLRQERIPWEAILDAYPVRVAGQAFIALELDKAFPAKAAYWRWTAWLNRALGAQEFNLNTSQINVDVHKLCTTVMLFIHLPKEERATLLATLHAHDDALR